MRAGDDGLGGVDEAGLVEGEERRGEEGRECERHKRPRNDRSQR